MNIDTPTGFNLSLIKSNLFFASAMDNFIHSQNKSFLSCFKSECPKFLPNSYDKKLTRDILQTISHHVALSFHAQVFCMYYELLRDNFDPNLAVNKSTFQRIKNHLEIDKTINNAKLLDMIRQSFSHNDDTKETPNFYFDDDRNFVFNKGSNKIVLTQEELLSFLDVYSKNITNNDFTEDTSIKYNLDKLQNINITPNNIGNFIEFFDSNGAKIELDKYQKEALAFNINIYKQNNYDLSNTHLLRTLFPTKRNIKNNLCQLANSLIITEHIYDNRNLTSNELMDTLQDEQNDKILFLFNFCHKNDYVFPYLKNMLYIALTCTHQNIINECVSKVVPDIPANRLRNSILHFTNFLNKSSYNLELYDDKELSKKHSVKSETNLEHIGSLSYDQLYNLCEEIFNKKVSVLQESESEQSDN